MAESLSDIFGGGDTVVDEDRPAENTGESLSDIFGTTSTIPKSSTDVQVKESGESLEDIFGGGSPVEEVTPTEVKTVKPVIGNTNKVNKPKTSNVFEGIKSRIVNLFGDYAQGLSRSKDAINRTVFTANPVAKMIFDATGIEIINQDELEQLKVDFDKIVKEDIGYEPSVKLDDLKRDGFLSKNLPKFIFERIATSIPDMVAVSNPYTILPYVTSLTNDNLNERLKNDDKELEDATVGDLTASFTGAFITAFLEKFAVGRIFSKTGTSKTLAGKSGNVLKEGLVQSGIETTQEALNYLAQTGYTKKGVDTQDLFDVMLESAIVGSGFGVTGQGTKEIAQTVFPTAFDFEKTDTETDTKVEPSLTNNDAEKIVNDNQTKLDDETAQTNLELSENVEDATDLDNLENELKEIDAKEVIEDPDKSFDNRDGEKLNLEDDLFEDATVQLNSEFGLDENESVVLNKVSYSPKMQKISDTIKDVFGVDLVFANFGENQNLVTNQGRVLGKFNGFRIDGRDAIFMDKNTFSFGNVLAHELTHVLETKVPEQFNILLDVAKKRISKEKQDEFRLNLNQARQEESGGVVDDSLFESELVAEMVGEQANDIEFWNDVYAGIGDQTLVQQFHQAIQEFYQKVLQQLKGNEFIVERQGIIEARKKSIKAFQNFSRKKPDVTNIPPQAQTEVLTAQTDQEIDLEEQADAFLDQQETSEYALSNIPTVEIPLSELILEGSVKQFKSGANEKGVVNPLVSDEYVRVGTAPIIVWERLDGRKEIISGRHRFDLAQRVGEQTIPSQILREADGVTKEDVYLLDIQNNILNNNGKVSDYVDFFALQDNKGNKYDRETARLQGFLSSTIGKRAFNIADNGTSLLITSFSANQNNLKPDGISAEKLANAFPNDDKKQAFGLRKLNDGLGIDQVINLLKVLETNPQPQQTTQSIFDENFDDSDLVKDAEEISGLVATKQNNIRKDIASVRGAVNDPERAKKMGLNINDPQSIQNKIDELQEQKRRLDNFATDSELMAQLREELNELKKKDPTRFARQRPRKITFDYDAKGSARITPQDVKVAKDIFQEELTEFNNQYNPRINLDDNIIKTSIASAKEDFYREDYNVAIEFETAFIRASNNLAKKLKIAGANQELDNAVTNLVETIKNDYVMRLRNYDRLETPERVAGGNPFIEPKTGQPIKFSRVNDPKTQIIKKLVDGKEVSEEELNKYPDLNRVYEETKLLINRGKKVVKKVFDSRLKKRLKDYELKLAPVKKIGRAIEKIMADYDGDTSQIKDIVRGSVLLETNSVTEINKVLTLIKSEFKTARIKRDTLTNTGVIGYRDINITGIEINGVMTELQVNVKYNFETKSKAHKLYKQRRSIDAELKTLENIPENFPEQRRLNNEISALEQQINEMYATSNAKLNDEYNASAGSVQRLNFARQSDSDISTPSDSRVPEPNERGMGLSSATTLPRSLATGTSLESKNDVPSGKENLPDESGLISNKLDESDINDPLNTTPSVPQTKFSREFKGDKYTIPKPTIGERISNKIIDSMSRILQVQKAIKKQGGIFTPFMDTSKALQKAYNRSGSLLEDFKKKVLNPIVTEIGAFNIDLSDLSNYLYARHSKEANEYIASINTEFPDGGSGMKNAEADQILSELERKYQNNRKFFEIADKLQAITKATQGILIEGGLVSPEMVAKWNARYDYFVPLRDFEQVDQDQLNSQGQGRKTGNVQFDFTKDFSKRRKGRSSKATNIIANIVNDYIRAIVNAEKNKVRQSFLAFILANKDDALWEVDPVKTIQTFVRNQNRVKDDLLVDETRPETIDADTGDVVMSPTAFSERVVQTTMGVDRGGGTIPVRYKGKIYSMRLNDPLMADDLEMKDGASNTPWRYLGKPVKFLSKMWTAYNPEFLMSNLQRDLQMTIASLGVEFDTKTVTKTLKNVPKMAWTVWKNLRNKDASNTVAITDPAGRQYTYNELYEMYKADGGKVGTLDIKSPEDRADEINSLIANVKSSWANPLTYHRKALKYLGVLEETVMDMNSSIEQMYRVASYSALIQQGFTRDQAGTVARNLTVNFARRGKLTPYIAPFYIFLNPAVQSVKKMGELLTSKKGSVMAGSLTTLGIVTAMMNADNEDDRTGQAYWNMQRHKMDKLRNLIYFTPEGDKYKIPLAYGLGFFVNLGYAIHDVGIGKMTMREASSFMTDSFFLHFSFLGGVGNFANFVAPTVIDPVITLSSETTESGLPLVPQNFSLLDEKADAHRYWSATEDTFYQRFAEWVNDDVFDGTESREGLISISPEKTKYLANFVGGGALSFTLGVIESIDLALNVDPSAPFEKNTIPFLRRQFQRETGKSQQIEYFKNASEVAKALNEWEEFETKRKYSLNDNVAQRVRANDSIAGLSDAIRTIQTAVSDMNKAEDEELENLDPREDQKRIYEIKNMYNKMRDDIYSEFNAEFYKSNETKKMRREDYSIMNRLID